MSLEDSTASVCQAPGPERVEGLAPVATVHTLPRKEPPVVLKRFTPDQSDRWDDHVRRARNGHFMFTRRYLEYHGDRFQDASLMALRDRQLVAVLPAHRVETSLVSHAGLPFAGWITHPRLRMRWMQAIFAALMEWMSEQGITTLVYKAIPHIYHRIPAEEDRYVLAQFGARCSELKVTAARNLGGPDTRNPTSRRCIRHARQAGITVRQWDDIEQFHAMHARWLAERHGAKPLHTLDEARLLAERFPHEIRIYAAFQGDQAITAQRLYISETVLRLQSLAETPLGRRLAANVVLQAWFDENHAFRGRWLDLGTSMDPVTGELAGSLFDYKESVGGRAVIVPTFSLTLR